MTVVTRVALLCGIFLCGLEGTAQTKRLRCSGTSCFVLHSEPRDFDGAHTGCTKSNTQILALTLREAEMSLPGLMRGSSGRYWLKLRSDSTDSPGEQCFAVSMSGPDNVRVSQEQCRNKQDGFLCHSALKDPCSRRWTAADTQVIFTTAHMDWELRESEKLPQGTIALVGKFGDEYPNAKYLCAAGSWLQAPWGCEVLKGGCELSCNSNGNTCTCPTGRALHPNNINCTIVSGPQEITSNATICSGGYTPAPDGTKCVDVDECTDGDPCTSAGEECLNTAGSYECRCKDGYDREDGVCTDFSICDKCEHMKCEKSDGVYACACRGGYRVSPLDPTKCLRLCEAESCVAECIYEESKGEKVLNCFCPSGFVRDSRNDTHLCTDIDECESGECDHKCENLYGNFRCSCNEGFELHERGRCVPVRDTEEDKDEEDKDEGDSGSGSPPALPSSHPATLPSYIKTGSVLGITVFLALCAALLCLVVRNMAKRCGSFELPSSFRTPDLDVFYLQQVTAETYKRLSFDKQFKNDLPRL